MHTEVMQTLRWPHVPGDTIFAWGAVALAWFVAGLKTGHSIRNVESEDSSVTQPKPAD
jgi:nitric oxide reductase subunit B